MKKLTTHSKSGLFLMEMILSLLFLSLTCTVCIRLMADSRTAQKKARELNHIQALTTSVGEILEGTDGKPESFLALLPGGTRTGDSLEYYFDDAWTACSSADFSYHMSICLSADSREKAAELSFSDCFGKSLYSLTIRYPLLMAEKEAAQ